MKKAIEGEILKNNALQFEASLEDAYSTSGIRNERNPEKVMAWAQDQRKQYMQQQGLDKYDDTISLAQNFAHPTARLLDGIIARHSRDVESQNANMLEQQMAQNIQDTLAAKQNLTSPLGGRDTKIPSDRVAYAQDAASVIMGKAEELKRLGYSQDRVVGFLGKLVLTGNHSARTARQLAQAITVDVNGQKVNLMQGFAEKAITSGEAEAVKASAQTLGELKTAMDFFTGEFLKIARKLHVNPASVSMQEKLDLATLKKNIDNVYKASSDELAANGARAEGQAAFQWHTSPSNLSEEQIRSFLTREGWNHAGALA